MNEDLFSGKDEGYEYFWELIKDGKRVNRGAAVTKSKASGSTRRRVGAGRRR